MEVPYNGPGKLTHHRGDGTNHVVLQGDEYLNIWPVYDWQKFPGTTVMQKEKMPSPENIQKDGLTDFVGAVTDGMYGAAAFDFRSPHDLLKAKKAWFFFDKEYVCLGADIYSRPRNPVTTTINQVLLKTEVTIEQNGKMQPLSTGSHELEKLKWVHQDGIGYILPQPNTLQVSNRPEYGRWSDITDQKNISKETVEKEVFKLWFDHGSSPDSAGYAYIVVPNISAEELQRTAASNRDIKILSNTRNLQAVIHQQQNIVQAAFYRAGHLDFSEIKKLKLDSQGMVMIQMNNNQITKLTVSDPSRKLTRMNLTLSGKYELDRAGISTIYNPSTSETLFIIDLPQGYYLGKSVSIPFR